MVIAIYFVQGTGSYYAWPERTQVSDLCLCMFRTHHLRLTIELDVFLKDFLLLTTVADTMILQSC